MEDGYRTLPLRLHLDVVLPASARGRQKIWLVGTSLGAMGSLAYVKRYPETVAGVVLLGPYLGEEPILDEIERAGGRKEMNLLDFGAGPGTVLWATEACWPSLTEADLGYHPQTGDRLFLYAPARAARK